MNALQLIAKLGAAGIKLWLDESQQLRFKAPKGALTPGLKAQLIEAKADIIHVLSQSQQSEHERIPAIERSDEKRLKLSFAQQRLWFLDRLDPGNPSYHIVAALKITGPLQVEILQQAFQSIVDRHESLRTTFLFKDNEVSQVIKPCSDWPLAENYDLSALPPKEQYSRLQEIAEDEALRSFDLTDGTGSRYRRIRLLRTRLARLTKKSNDNSEHVLFITLHHIIADGWSIGVLIKELSSLYHAYIDGKPSPLIPLEIQYADFAEWQHKWLAGENIKQQLEYWKTQLNNTSLLELPTDFVRPAVMRNHGANMRFEIPLQLSQQLQTYAKAQGKTLFMVLMTAFQILLKRYSGQSDICVGTPVANRTRPQIEPLIGCFINTVAIRGDLDKNPSFNDLLTQISQTIVDAYANQDVPFEQLVDEISPSRDQSFTPIYQVMFSLENAALDYALALDDLTIERLPLESHTAKYDLQLHIVEGDPTKSHQALIGEIEYNTDLFKPDTIQRLSQHFTCLLESILANPELPLHQLNILGHIERAQLIGIEPGQCNDTNKHYGDVPALHALFEHQVAQHPDRPALSDKHSTLTYQQVNEQVNQLAHHLRHLGVDRDQLVGVCMERSTDLSIALLAIHKAGGAYVPFDPNFPAERLSFMAQDTQIKVLLTQSHLGDRTHSLDHLHIIKIDKDTDKWSSEPITNLGITNQPKDLFNVIYTSGSTGKPKGVMVPHQGIINRLLWMQETYPLDASDRVLQKTPYSFDVSVWELFWPLIVGSHLIYSKPEGHKDPDYLKQIIVDKRITTLHFVPSMLGLFLQTAQINQCTSIKRVFSSGEALPVEYERRFFECLSKAELHNLYGPTEASIDVSYYACKPKSTYSSVPIGKPVANTQLHILDSELQPVPLGVVGELYLGGIQLARGYLNRDDLTLSTFIDNPFYGSGHPSPKLYKTGDLARIHTDGNVEYMGRIDHQVKVRGFRIELGEIEAVIARTEPVKEVAVSTYKASDGNTLLAGYIVLNEGFSDEDHSASLRGLVRAELPEYMVPNRFIVLDELPLSANGKLDRKRLPTPSADSASSTQYVAPNSSTETLLCELWCEVLNLERIGTQDNFFELGGHSLLATKLVSRISESFDIDLPLRALFDHPTVITLAVKVEEAAETARRPAITAVDRNQPLPMSMAQERLWIIEQLSPGNTAYNMPAALRLRGNIDSDILATALDQLVARHESLRTYFASDSQGIGLQVIGTDNLAKLSIEDADESLDPSNPEAYLQKILNEEANTPFVLTSGPLFRARLISLGHQDHALLINMHHIISDGWSISILQREWVAIYNALMSCSPIELADLTVQYADYAQWQRQWLSADVQKLNLDFWLDNLADAPACITLPLDRPRPEQQSFAGASYQFTLDTDKTLALKQLSQSSGNTLYTSLLASFGLLLSRYSGQSDVCIGTPVAGRQDSALEGLIGYFINTVVIRGDLSGNPSVLQLLERYKQASLNAFAHQDIPIEKVLDALPIERNISYPPVAQVGFNFINADIATMPTHLGDASVEYIESQKVVAKYDLTLIFIETEKGLEATAEYNSDLFDTSTIATMMLHYQRLVDQFITAANQPIDTLALLESSELYSAVGISPEEYEDVRALTPMQRDLYLNTQVNPEGLSNNLGYHIFIDGPLDIETWRQASQTIANKHPVLRTDIIDSSLRMGDIAYQCVARESRVDIEVIDLRNQAPSEKDVFRTINQVMYRPFSLYTSSASKGHLTRYALILVNDQQTVAVTVMHHAITDGISLAMQGQLALRTYRELKGEATANTASESLELSDQFTAYSQSIELKTDVASTREFWQERLTSVQGLQCPAPIRLQASEQSSRRYTSVSLDSDTWGEIKRFCRKQKITPALYFKCLYGLLINQYCRPEGDFAITEFNAGRDRQTQFSFGCFFQQTPFVFEQSVLSANESIPSLLSYARQFQKAAKPHQPVSIMLQHKLQPQGGLQFMYNYYHFFPTTELIDGKPVHHQEYPPLVDTAIQLITKELPDGCKLDLLFEADLFLGDDLLDRLLSLSEQIVRQGILQLGELSYINEQEHQQQVIDWNQTDVDLPNNTSVQSLFEAQAVKTPDAIAVISDDVQLSYQALNEQANQLAHYLRQKGVGSDVRVGIGLGRSAEFVISVLAIIKAGGAYVPVDASYPKERIHYMLKDAHAPILICNSALQNELSGYSNSNYSGSILCLDHPEVQDTLSQLPSENPVDQTDIDDLLYIIYTSGSTGKPKGAGVVHQGELNLLNWYTREAKFDENTRCLVISSTGFDLTQKNIFAPLVSGGALVIPAMPHYDGDAISQLIDQEKITIINCAPSAFYPLVEDNQKFEQLSSLKQLIMGGEAIRIERLASWLESQHCNAVLVNNYGPTECTDIAAFEYIENPLDYINQPVPIGKPNDNVQLYILNNDNQLLPTGAIGELCIAGLGVGRGYLNHDHLNIEKFIANPFGDGQLYRTGDLMRYRPDGKLDFIGRKDFQVKLNGLRIELGEIESALREQSDINDALATVTDNTLVAYVTFSQSESLDQTQRVTRWTQALRDYLPSHMIPSVIIPLEAWPLTPNGKIDRKALPNPSEHSHNQREYVAPRNDIEQQLAAILCHVLGLSRVGVHDDFFDIGGHSLAASRAITQIRDIFNIEIPLNVLFEKTTIEGLAEYISVSQWAANNANQPETSEDDGPREEGFL